MCFDFIFRGLEPDELSTFDAKIYRANKRQIPCQCARLNKQWLSRSRAYQCRKDRVVVMKNQIVDKEFQSSLVF